MVVEKFAFNPNESTFKTAPNGFHSHETQSDSDAPGKVGSIYSLIC